MKSVAVEKKQQPNPRDEPWKKKFSSAPQQSNPYPCRGNREDRETSPYAQGKEKASPKGRAPFKKVG